MSLRERFKAKVAPFPLMISSFFHLNEIKRVIEHHHETCQKCDLENGEICEHYYEDYVQCLGPIGRWFA